MKKLPQYHSLVGDEVSRTKGFFYIGRSQKIDKVKGDAYGTKYGISGWRHDAECYKVGITKNLQSRLSNYKTEILDFEYLKTWEVKAYKHLESTIINNHYKAGFESYGSEWFIGNKEQYNDLIKEVEWLIDNTYYQKNNRYYSLYGGGGKK